MARRFGKKVRLSYPRPQNQRQNPHGGETAYEGRDRNRRAVETIPEKLDRLAETVIRFTGEPEEAAPRRSYSDTLADGRLVMLIAQGLGSDRTTAVQVLPAERGPTALYIWGVAGNGQSVDIDSAQRSRFKTGDIAIISGVLDGLESLEGNQNLG